MTVKGSCRCKAAVLLLVLAGLVLALEPPVPLMPQRGNKGPNNKPELVVSCPSSAEMLHFRLFVDGNDEPVAEIQTPYRSWVAPEGNEVNGTLPEELLPGIYYWTCRARYDDVWTDFFEPLWDFEVTAIDLGKPQEAVPFGNAPQVPNPIWPPRGSKGPSQKPELIVVCPSRAEELHFQVFIGEEDEPIAEVYTPGRSWVVPEGNILQNPLPEELMPGIYYWTCRARYDDVWSGFFEPRWDFEVERVQPPEFERFSDQLSWTLPLKSTTPDVYHWNQRVNNGFKVAPQLCGPQGMSIGLALAQRSKVSAAVYNTSGRLVRSIATHELHGPGICELAWDGTDASGNQVSTGTYLCRISSGDNRHVVKVVKSR